MNYSEHDKCVSSIWRRILLLSVSNSPCSQRSDSRPPPGCTHTTRGCSGPSPRNWTDRSSAAKPNTRQEQLVPPAGCRAHYSPQRSISIIWSDSESRGVFVFSVCASHWCLQSLSLILDLVWGLIQWKTRTPLFLHHTLQLETRHKRKFFKNSFSIKHLISLTNDMKNEMQLHKTKVLTKRTVFLIFHILLHHFISKRCASVKSGKEYLKVKFEEK